MQRAAPPEQRKPATSWRFIRSEGGMVGFGFLHALGSGFGQTFFVSLFVPHMLASLGWERTAFSAAYAGATVGSALLLPWLGRAIDVMPLGRFSSFVALGLAAACTGLGVAQSAVGVLLSLLAVRLCGQGLMSHVSASATARHFSRARGKALSVASLGHPFSEILYPGLATAAIAQWGWRNTWLAAAVLVLVVVGPLGQLLLYVQRHREHAGLALEQQARPADPETHARPSWTRRQVFRDRHTWALLPLLHTPSFVLTGLFFHQLALADARGWSHSWMAASFTAFGLFQAVSAFGVGPLIDRLGAASVLRLHLLPLGLGVALVALGQSPYWAPVYLGLAGLTMGSGGAARTAFFAEAFGVAHFGAIRAAFSMISVLATAAAPPVFGWLLDADFSFGTLLWLSSGLLVAASGLGSLAIERWRADMPA